MLKCSAQRLPVMPSVPRSMGWSEAGRTNLLATVLKLGACKIAAEVRILIQP